MKIDLSWPCTIPSSSYLNNLKDKYNNGTTGVLDKHAPEIVGKIAIRKPTPWTNAEIKKLKSVKLKRNGGKADWLVTTKITKRKEINLMSY